MCEIIGMKTGMLTQAMVSWGTFSAKSKSYTFISAKIIKDA
jgi:hypothetical protein